MKRLAFVFLIASLFLLALGACAGEKATPGTASNGIGDPVAADQPFDLSLAGAANSGTATVPPLCSGASNADTAANAAEVIRLVNLQRAASGLGALTAHTNLRDAAQKHAIDMACHSFLSHTGTDGSTAFSRMTAFGYSFLAAGENIGAGQMTPQEIVNDWMASSGHRAIILTAEYLEIGVGYVYNDNDTAGYYDYWVMDVGRR